MRYNFNCVIDVKATDDEKCKAARILHEVFPHWGVIKNPSPTKPIFKDGEQIGFEWKHPREEQQTTFYCLFYPIGIYCEFGASNIHHAYNKAAKYWGAKPYLSEYDKPTNSSPHAGCIPVFSQLHRIKVCESEKAITDCNKYGTKYRKVSHCMMTELIKAWRKHA